MLGLLSKPQAAAHLFSSEIHAQAGSPPPGPLAPTLPAHPCRASDSSSPHPQAAPSLQASQPGAAEVINADSIMPGSIPQPALVPTQSVMRQAEDAVAASYAAAQEAETPKYEQAVWQSCSTAAGAAQSVAKSRSGSGDGPGVGQLTGSEPQQNTVHGVLETESRAAVALAFQSCSAGEGTHTQLEPQAPTDLPTASSQGPAGPISAGVPAGTVTVTQQASAQQHEAFGTSSMAGAQQQPQVPSQTLGQADQQATAASSHLVAAGTGAGTGVGVGSGVAAGTAATSAGAGTHTAARTGTLAGKGGKHKGGGRGSKGQEVGMRLTGSAAQALAVLQAGMPPKLARAEDNTGAHMPVLPQIVNENNNYLSMRFEQSKGVKPGF